MLGEKTGKDCRRQHEKQVKKAMRNSKSISRVADLRSELRRAVICLDLLLYQSKQISKLNIYIIFSMKLYLALPC